MSASREYVTEAQAAAVQLRIHPAGTVIFPKRGGAIATNKKRVLASPAALDLNTMAVIPRADLDPDYLYVFFETLDLASPAHHKICDRVRIFARRPHHQRDLEVWPAGQPLCCWVPRCGVDDAVAQRVDGGLGTVGHAEFGEHAGYVGFHRFFADAQRPGDVPVGSALREGG